MKGAFKAAIQLQLVIPALLIHGIAPRLFVHTASNAMKDILKDRNVK